MATYTPEQRLARARMSLMNHKTWCLYSGLLMLGKLEVVEVPSKTAATNGRDVKFDPRFIEQLTDAELRFVLLHETEHKALRQLSMYEHLFKKNHQVANMAADFVVNIRIQDADNDENFITMPKPPAGAQVCIDPKFRGWSTKQVFDHLMQNAPPQQKPQSGKGKKGKPEDGEGDSDGGPQGFDEHDTDGADAMSDEEKKELKKEIDQAVRQGALLAGKMAGASSRLLQDVLESQIRWQEILAEFVKSVTKGRDDASWSKVNRRWVSSGLYLPSPVSETVGELVVGIDASGSTWSGNQLEGFIGELVAICEDVTPEKVTVLWWDTQVQKVQEYDPSNYNTMLETLSIEGGGGTRPSCVTDWIAKQEPKREYVAAIMLSDGQVGNDWGNWGALPVLWVVNTKGIIAPVGQTLYIGES